MDVGRSRQCDQRSDKAGIRDHPYVTVGRLSPEGVDARGLNASVRLVELKKVARDGTTAGVWGYFLRTFPFSNGIFNQTHRTIKFN